MIFWILITPLPGSAGPNEFVDLILPASRMFPIHALKSKVHQMGLLGKGCCAAWYRRHSAISSKEFLKKLLKLLRICACSHEGYTDVYFLWLLATAISFLTDHIFSWLYQEDIYSSLAHTNKRREGNTVNQDPPPPPITWCTLNIKSHTIQKHKNQTHCRWRHLF